MWFKSFLTSCKSGISRSRQPQPLPARRGTRLVLEELETRLTPSLSTLASFAGAPSGANPHAGLIMDSIGNLYGTTPYGGASGDGTVFELARGSGTITTLASFNGTNGADPEAALIMDSSGNLYGTTYVGGASKRGTVFELVHGSSTITTLASFNGADGSGSYAALIMDSSGNLYGTTPYGGASGDGTVFELAHGSHTITTLASFNGTNGEYPHAGVIMDSSGNLYGTTYGAGGLYSAGLPVGTVFELAHDSHTITTLASGLVHPEAALIMDSSGNLYGTTYGSVSAGIDYLIINPGTVFELAHGSNRITTLWSFPVGAYYDGAFPEGSLIMDSSGNLYGTTTQGGFGGYGTVFELAHGGGFTTLASFNGANGAYPDAGLIMDSSGNLYGTTAGAVGLGARDGQGGWGTIFELQGPGA